MVTGVRGQHGVSVPPRVALGRHCACAAVTIHPLPSVAPTVDQCLYYAMHNRVMIIGVLVSTFKSMAKGNLEVQVTSHTCLCCEIVSSKRETVSGSLLLGDIRSILR